MTRRVVVTVEAITTDRWSGVPGDVRVRRFLKNALRSFGLRVVTVEPVEMEQPRGEVPKIGSPEAER